MGRQGSNGMSQFELFDQGKRQAYYTDNQRQIFVDKYSVEIEFPAYYYYDSRFVPHAKDLIVVLAFHIIP